MKIAVAAHFLIEFSDIKFHVIVLSGSWIVTCVRTDGRTDGAILLGIPQECESGEKKVTEIIYFYAI